MEEMKNNWEFPAQPKPVRPFFPTAKRELVFGVLMVMAVMLMFNSIIFSGFNLGFAIFAGAGLICTVGYLLWSGCRFTGYSGALLGISLVILAAFARSDDGFVKGVMACFLMVSANLGLCLMAGQNRRNAGGIGSLLEAPRTLFMLGVGKLPETFRGLGGALRRSGTLGKKTGAVALGLLIALPLLGIVIALLTSADAAFAGVIELLPDWDATELIATVFVGIFPAIALYGRGVALHHNPKQAPVQKQPGKGISALTVNTVLSAISVVYGVYLLSQLAYISGGFSGILPEEYTLAQYARRGFFEMAWLCAINLGIIALAMGLVKKDAKAPLATRLLCLFVGFINLFMVAAASAKMMLYIDAYGLTRLRVLTEVIMVWVGIATLIVMIWLFASKLPYMKAVLLSALILGAATIWADVDTVVAAYNVQGYQSGQLSSVDVGYLRKLGDGAIPYIAQLKDVPDEKVAKEAERALLAREYADNEDYRSWNYVSAAAAEYEED